MSSNNMMRSGLAWLTDKLKTVASEPVTYIDRQGNQIPCRATLGKKLLKLDDQMGGFRMEWTTLDVLIPASDLMVNGVTIEPQRGDQVLLTVGGKQQSYEVAPYESDPPWVWSDPHQSMMRIHCKLVEIES